MRTHDCILALLLLASAPSAFAPAAAQTPTLPDSALDVPSGSDPALDVPPGWQSPGPLDHAGPGLPPPPASPQRLTPPATFTDVVSAEVDYPPESFRLGEQGIVRSRFLLTETGEATECTIEATSGYPRLDEAACGLVATVGSINRSTDGGKAVASLITVNLCVLHASSASSRCRRPNPERARSLSSTDRRRQVPPLIAALLTPAEAANSHAVTADDYPADSIRMQEQGAIGLMFIVDETGDVSECAVTSSSGYPRLDAAARAMVVNRWKYKPAILDGKATAIIHNGQRRISTSVMSSICA